MIRMLVTNSFTQYLRWCEFLEPDTCCTNIYITANGSLLFSVDL